MSEAPESDQKTLDASAKRKRDAASKGDTVQSRDLATALVVVGGAIWLVLAGRWFVDSAMLTLRDGLTIESADISQLEIVPRVARLGRHVLGPLAALFGTASLAAIAGPALLGNLAFRSGAFMPKFSRLNPVSGLKRVLGIQGLVELMKSVLKVVLLGGVGCWLVMHWLPRLMLLSLLELQGAAASVGLQVVTITICMASALVLIGLVDAPIQILRRNARLRMTHHEMKEENRESEGSPENKHMARQRRHELLNGSARRTVSEASVVLTNPTHFAIALRYRPLIDAVPVVVARGRGETALAIRQLAKDASVPLLEYPQLTRAIYFTTRAGQPIASDLYIAVATVLAFVFNIDREMAAGRAKPIVDVPSARTFDENGVRAS